MAHPVKRSNAPVFWLLFGAGGMLAALLGPMLVFITGIAAPLGWVLKPDALSYDNMLAFARNIPGKIFIFAVITLFVWHAAHRIYHTLHDLGIRRNGLSMAFCYGISLAATLVCGYALIAIGM